MELLNDTIDLLARFLPILLGILGGILLLSLIAGAQGPRPKDKHGPRP